MENDTTTITTAAVADGDTGLALAVSLGNVDTTAMTGKPNQNRRMPTPEQPKSKRMCISPAQMAMKKSTGGAQCGWDGWPRPAPCGYATHCHNGHGQEPMT